MSAAFPGHERARHMGELRRGDQHWDVYLETQPDPDLGAVRGRLHFVASGGEVGGGGGGLQRHRMTGWVFLEWQERDIQDRFGEFSAAELWQFIESLEGVG